MPAVRPRLLARLLLAVLLPSGATIAAAQEQAGELPQPQTLEELQKAMKDVLEKDHVPGAGIALISKGQLLWCGGIGMADLAASRPAGCDTEFRVGSISKTFVALALLKLQDDGKVNLYARLKDVAPEVPLKNKWAANDPVRIVNLLEHTAGFDDMTPSEVYNRHDSADFPLLKVFEEHPEPQIVRWPPGTQMSYSNPGYGVAGYAIEKASGEHFDRYIRENILAPLEITTGDFELTEANRKLLAQGYQNNPPRPVAYKNIYLRPAGDMKASPGELAKLVRFFLLRGFANGKALFKPETIARMEYPETTSSAKHGLRLGYGLANYTSVQGGVVTHGHDGGIDGFLSTYRYMPEQNWGYVVLLNSDASGKALRDLNALAIDFLSRDFPKPYQPVTSLSPEQLSGFAGYYAERAPRSQVLAFLGELLGGERMRVTDGKLTRKAMFEKPETLLPAGKNLFRLEKDPEATMVFFQGRDGRMQFVSRGASAGELERVSSVWPDLRLGLLAICFALMASSLVFPLVWLVQWAAGRMKGMKHFAVRVLPVLAVLALIAAAFGGTRAVQETGVFTLWSFLFFAGTILFAILSLAALWFAVRVPRQEIHPGIRVYSFLVSLACCMVTIFLSSWHLIGYRFWGP